MSEIHQPDHKRSPNDHATFAILMDKKRVDLRKTAVGWAWGRNEVGDLVARAETLLWEQYRAFTGLFKSGDLPTAFERVDARIALRDANRSLNGEFSGKTGRSLGRARMVGNFERLDEVIEDTITPEDVVAREEVLTAVAPVLCDILAAARPTDRGALLQDEDFDPLLSELGDDPEANRAELAGLAPATRRQRECRARQRLSKRLLAHPAYRRAVGLLVLLVAAAALFASLTLQTHEANVWEVEGIVADSPDDFEDDATTVLDRQNAAPLRGTQDSSRGCSDDAVTLTPRQNAAPSRVGEEDASPDSSTDAVVLTPRQNARPPRQSHEDHQATDAPPLVARQNVRRGARLVSITNA